MCGAYHEGGGVGAAHAAALEDEGGVVDPGRDRRRGVLGEAVGDRSDAAHRGQPIGGGGRCDRAVSNSGRRRRPRAGAGPAGPPRAGAPRGVACRRGQS